MSKETYQCPRCGGQCSRDEVHNGVAMLYGPWGCSCGWSEYEEYDQTTAQQPDDGQIDQWGGFTRTQNGTDINCDFCHTFQPVRFCETCGLDWCKRCELIHDATHEEVKELVAEDIDAPTIF